MQITCCKGCDKRTVEPNCHMVCAEYLRQRALRDRELESIYAEGIVKGYQHTVSLDIAEAMNHMHKQQKRRR